MSELFAIGAPTSSLVVTSLLAVLGLSHVTAVFSNRPTPLMGATERASQYLTNLWYAILAVKLSPRW